MMDGLLADKKLLGLPDLRMLQKTLGELQASGDQAAFESCEEKSRRCFRRSSIPKPDDGSLANECVWVDFAEQRPEGD